MAQPTVTKLRGVHTHQNRLSEVPEGSLARAQNVIIDRESIVEPRRGLPFYGSAIVAPGSACRRLIPFEGKLIAHVGSTLYQDNGSGTWSAFTGTFAEPASGFRIRDAKSNKNLFITTSTGLKKLSTLSGTWLDAGVPPPLSGTGTTTGSSGFMTDNTAVGYRAVLYYTDANDNEIVSAPSSRVLVQNNTGGDRDVSLTFYLPTGLTTDFYYRIYRSANTADSLSNPSEELQQVDEGRLTSAQISAGSFTITEQRGIRFARLYTNPSEEGLQNANAQPPKAKDLCEFKGYMLYANLIGKHRFFLSLVGVGGGALTQGLTDATVGTTDGSPILTGISSTTNFQTGMKVKGASGIPSTARILSIDGANQVTMTVNATATATVSVVFQHVISIAGREYFGTSATDASANEFLVTDTGESSSNIRRTALELIQVVNRDTSASVYGFYDSEFDDIPGLLHFEERALGGAAFEIATSTPTAFFPLLPKTADGSQPSKSDERPNFIISSKLQQSEAVPLGGGIWSGKTAIQRIVPLRDAVIVLSDVVGVFTGDGPENFTYDELDSTVKLVGPETAVVLNDAVYCNSTQGVVRITTQGVQLASRAIERDLIKASNITGFADEAFAVSYESDRAYLLWVPTSSSDDVPTFFWRHNAFTQEWTHGNVEASTGLVNPADDKLYVVDFDTLKARKERKSFDRTDYADEEFAITIASSTGTTVTVNSTTSLQDNDLLVQGANESRIVDVVNGTTLLVSETIAWSAAAATVYRPILCVVDPVPVAFGNPGIMKHVPEVAFLFRSALFKAFTVGFATNFLPVLDDYVVSLEPADTDSEWTVEPDGSSIDDEQPVRTIVPQEVQRGHWFYLSMAFSICRETMAIAGISFKARELSPKFQGAVQ